MRPRLATIVLPAILLVNAAVILFFRFFITVDGPLHVLYASLNSPWAAMEHMAHGVGYNSAGLHDWLGDRILMVLLLFSDPVRAHDLFAALVSCALVLSVLAYLRAHGTRMSPAILWLAPLTFNLLLFMGLFHFLLGVAVAFGTMAWWKWRAASPLTRWLGLLIGLAVAWHTHRGSPVLLGILFLPAFVIELAHGRTIATIGSGNLRRGLAIVIALLAVVAFQLHKILQGIQLPFPSELPVFDADLLLRPLLLPGLAEGPWPVRGIGLLLLIAVGAGACARLRMGRKLFAQDALLILFALFTTIAWLGNTPLGRQLLIAERAQWLALVMLAIWLITIADAHRGKFAHVIGAAALCVLPLQFIRLVQAEEPLSRLQQPHSAVMEACDHLEPGTLVVPVMAEPDWLLQHLWACAAVEHTGILLAPNDRVVFTSALGAKLDPRIPRMAKDPYWIMRHWREGIPPEVDQVLFIGSGIERATQKHPWPVLLQERHEVGFENGYARIYDWAGISVRPNVRDLLARTATNGAHIGQLLQTH